MKIKNHNHKNLKSLKNINKNNYWINLSDKIPWHILTSIYSPMIKHKNYNIFPIRLIIGCILIQEKENLSDDDTIKKITENIELQYFIGMSNSYKLIKFDVETFNFYKEQLGKNIINEIYNMISAYNVDKHSAKSYYNNTHLISTIHSVILCCLALHIIFIIFFIMTKFKILICLNTYGILICLLCTYLTKINKISFTISLICVELFTYSFLNTIILGWSSAFQYYILAIVPLILLSKYLKLKWKATISLLSFSFYLILNLLTYTFHLIQLHIENYKLGNINISLLFLFIVIILYKYNNEIIKQNYNLKILSSKFKINSEFDQLTGLFNRRHMMDIINYYKAQYDLTQVPFVIAIADIDKFKSVNDLLGHECGDFVLVEASYNMRKTLNQNGIICRWGGEEFLFIFPNTSLEEGFRKMDNIRKTLMKTPINYNESILQITITAGIQIYDGNFTIEDTLKNADNNLYYGKKSGRNRVIFKETKIYDCS